MAFRVNRKYPKILRQRKRRIERRLERRNYTDQPQPMMTGGNVHYEMADKTQAVTVHGSHTICGRETELTSGGKRQEAELCLGCD